MKGIIFNLLEGFITDGWGEERYEAILSCCTLATQEPFIGPATYPDADLLQIVDRTVGQLGVSTAEVLHAFGRYCFPRLAVRVPTYMRGHTHPRTFLFTLDEIHRTEVMKLFRGATPPRITCRDAGEDAIIVRYESSRHLCRFVTGLLVGTGDWFGMPVHWTETQCATSGADACEFRVVFG